MWKEQIRLLLLMLVTWPFWYHRICARTWNNKNTFWFRFLCIFKAFFSAEMMDRFFFPWFFLQFRKCLSKCIIVQREIFFVAAYTWQSRFPLFLCLFFVKCYPFIRIFQIFMQFRKNFLNITKKRLFIFVICFWFSLSLILLFQLVTLGLNAPGPGIVLETYS